MYHTEPPTDKTIREWYMNSSRVAACALRNEDAPEDGQNNCPKHVELTGIINKPLLFHLVGCLYYLYFIIFFETC